MMTSRSGFFSGAASGFKPLQAVSSFISKLTHDESLIIADLDDTDEQASYHLLDLNLKLGKRLHEGEQEYAADQWDARKRYQQANKIKRLLGQQEEMIPTLVDHPVSIGIKGTQKLSEALEMGRQRINDVQRFVAKALESSLHPDLPTGLFHAGNGIAFLDFALQLLNLVVNACNRKKNEAPSMVDRFTNHLNKGQRAGRLAASGFDALCSILYYIHLECNIFSTASAFMSFNIVGTLISFLITCKRALKQVEEHGATLKKIHTAIRETTAKKARLEAEISFINFQQTFPMNSGQLTKTHQKLHGFRKELLECERGLSTLTAWKQKVEVKLGQACTEAVEKIGRSLMFSAATTACWLLAPQFTTATIALLLLMWGAICLFRYVKEKRAEYKALKDERKEIVDEGQRVLTGTERKSGNDSSTASTVSGSDSVSGSVSDSDSDSSDSSSSTPSSSTPSEQKSNSTPLSVSVCTAEPQSDEPLCSPAAETPTPTRVTTGGLSLLCSPSSPLSYATPPDQDPAQARFYQPAG